MIKAAILRNAALVTAALTPALLFTAPARAQKDSGTAPVKRQAKNYPAPAFFVCFAPTVTAKGMTASITNPEIKFISGTDFSQTWNIGTSNGQGKYSVTASPNKLELYGSANLMVIEKTGKKKEAGYLILKQPFDPFIFFEKGTYTLKISTYTSFKSSSSILDKNSPASQFIYFGAFLSNLFQNQYGNYFNNSDHLDFETHIYCSDTVQNADGFILTDGQPLPKEFYTQPGDSRYRYQASLIKIIDAVLQKKALKDKVQFGQTIVGFGEDSWHQNTSVNASAISSVVVTIVPEEKPTMVEDLPDIMDNIGLNMGANAMRIWMGRSYQLANAELSDDKREKASWDHHLPILGVDIAKGQPWVNQINMDWIKSPAANRDVSSGKTGQSVIQAYLKALDPNTLVTQKHYDALVTKLKKYNNSFNRLKPGESIPFGPHPQDFSDFRKNIIAFHEQFQTQLSQSENIDDASKKQIMTDVTAAIGKTTFYIAPYGDVYKSNAGDFIFSIQGAYVYFVDSYDFNDTRSLGVWKKPDKVGRFRADEDITENGGTIIKQHKNDTNFYNMNPNLLLPTDSFEEYRVRHTGKGGDYLIVPPQPILRKYENGPIIFTIDRSTLKIIKLDKIPINSKIKQLKYAP